MTNAFFYGWAFVFGLIFGSFANVVVLRDKDRKSILHDRSRCPACKHTLAWYDLFPLLSWLALRGRCRYCKAPISAQYPLVEAVAGLLAVFAVWHGYVQHGSWILTVGLFAAFFLLLAISVIDIISMEVPLEYCVAAGIIGGFARMLAGQADLANVMLGITAGAGSLALVLYGWKLLFKQDGMGEGDIWIAGALGAIAGYPLIWITLMAAVMLGAIISLIILGFTKQSLKAAVPFGPFLFLGLLVALAAGQTIAQWYILRI